MAGDAEAAEISVEALQAHLERGDAYVVDVRLPFDYFGGRVPGAINMPGDSITQNVDRIPAGACVVLVCDDGVASRRAALAAAGAGFTNVSVLAGGYDAWLAADLPSETISEGVLAPQPAAARPKS